MEFILEDPRLPTLIKFYLRFTACLLLSLLALGNVTL